VRELIRASVEEGAMLVTGGAEPAEHLPRGLRPALFADVRPDMRIAGVGQPPRAGPLRLRGVLRGEGAASL